MGALTSIKANAQFGERAGAPAFARVAGGVALALLAAGCSGNAGMGSASPSSGGSTPAGSGSGGSTSGAASTRSSAADQATAPNTLSAREQREGWQLLFDGQSISKYWRAYKADTVSPRWQVIDGIMTKTRPSDDLVTRQQFGDFEFAWEWRVAPGGNAGVFYRATESESKIYWTAPEFQIADDSLTPDSKNPLTSAGAAYGLYAPPKGVAKFAGNWNASRILVRGNHVEHWMNGIKTIEYEIGSPDWKEKVAASKFKPYPNWGLARTGVIGIQGDHSGMLQLRNLKIRVIK